MINNSTNHFLVDTSNTREYLIHLDLAVFTSITKIQEVTSLPQVCISHHPNIIAILLIVWVALVVSFRCSLMQPLVWVISENHKVMTSLEAYILWQEVGQVEPIYTAGCILRIK